MFVIDGFLHHWTNESLIQETGADERTVVKYMRIIKNALHLEMVEQTRGMVLGGNDVVVQIDESHLFKNKYHVGRIPRTMKEVWVFGMVEDVEDGRLYMQLVQHRDKQTLEGIIRQHLQQNTTVFSDCWPSYNGLRLIDGLTHYKVNHKEHFVSWEPVHRTYQEQQQIIRDAQAMMFEDDDFAEEAEEEGREWCFKVHTNKIKRVWLEVKRGLKGQPLFLLRRNLNAELFRYNYLRRASSLNAKRETILSTIAKHQTNLIGLKQERIELFPII